MPAHSASSYARVARRLANPLTFWDKVVRFVLIGSWMLLGVAALIRLLVVIESGAVYEQDFLQDYLMAKAVDAGADPYDPVQILARRYLDSIPPEMLALLFPHPSPHPPTTAILALPFSRTDIGTAAFAWLAVEMVFLFLAVRQLARLSDTTLPPGTAFFVTVGIIGFPPVHEDLSLGQVNPILLLLLTMMLLALRAGHPVRAGIWLGCTFLVKQLFWPVLVLFALQRRWHLVAAAVAVPLCGYLATSLVLGPDAILKYVTVALPATTDAYKAQLGNISLWTVGWRVFYGGLRPMDTTPVSLPLFAQPEWATPTSILLPALVLLVGLWFTARKTEVLRTTAIMICVSILVSPIAWSHYLVIATIPLLLLWQGVANRGFQVGLTTASLAASIPLLVSSGWGGLAILTTNSSSALADAPLPAQVSIALLVLTVALVALAYLIAKLEDMESVLK